MKTISISEDCLMYLKMIDTMAQPERSGLLSVKGCTQQIQLTEKRISDRIKVDLDRLIVVLHKLDIAINFRVPTNTGENFDIHARNLNHFLHNEKVQNFLLCKSDTIETRYGVIKYENFQKHC